MLLVCQYWLSYGLEKVQNLKLENAQGQTAHNNEYNQNPGMLDGHKFSMNQTYKALAHQERDEANS